VPRADRFEPPGPQLTRTNAPGLFDLVDGVARATAQRPPSEVYLLNEVNAWVTHRGGVMGLGSRRVMGVGLPLLAHLSTAELKAVIAHEFGHYVSGDVSLGPWIYKTRSAIGRATAATHETFLEAPFRAYAQLFLKTTLAVSREQEFVADQTAAKLAGSRVAVSALRRVYALGPAYSAYLSTEVTPVLQSGFLPPIAAGFDRFLERPRTAAFMESVATAPSSGDEAGAYDSHPPLADRIQALERLPASPPSDADQVRGPALAQVDVHAKALLRHTLGSDLMGRLKPIAWKDVGEAVYLQRWHQMGRNYAGWFGTRTVGQIPSGQEAFIQLGSELVGQDEVNVNSEERIHRATQLLTAGLGSALTSAGWSIETGPGDPLELVNGDKRLDPGVAIARLASGDESAGEWQSFCEDQGIASLPLTTRACAGEGSTAD
jgi:Zn-dependent protease with chaperone function